MRKIRLKNRINVYLKNDDLYKEKIKIMFSGIIYNLGKVTDIKKSTKYVSGSLVIEISSRINFKKSDIGRSVCCNGVCLTLIRIKKKFFYSIYLKNLKTFKF